MTFSRTKAHTIPYIAKRPLLVSGAAYSKENILTKPLLPSEASFRPPGEGQCSRERLGPERRSLLRFVVFLVPQNLVFGDGFLGGIVDGFLQSANFTIATHLETGDDCLN